MDTSNNICIEITPEKTFNIGDKVYIDSKGKGHLLPATILSINKNNNTYVVEYNDGNRETNVIKKWLVQKNPHPITKIQQQNKEIHLHGSTTFRSSSQPVCNEDNIQKQDYSTLHDWNNPTFYEVNNTDSSNNTSSNNNSSNNNSPSKPFRYKYAKYRPNNTSKVYNNNNDIGDNLKPHNIQYSLRDSDSDSGEDTNNKLKKLEQLNEISNIYNNKHTYTAYKTFVNLNGIDNANNIDIIEDDTHSSESKYADNKINSQQNDKLINTINGNISKVALIGLLQKLEINWHEIDYIKKYINETFSSNLVSTTSTHLDIIVSYLNCQKSIYTESSHYTATWLNYLMIPTIIISATASVISGSQEIIPHSQLIISCITAFSAFLLSVINYLKLDAATEAHKISAHQYDKLQSHIMFFSGKSLLFSSAAFNTYTRTDRESKRLLQAKNKVRKQIQHEQLKYSTDIQELKKNYKKEKKELEIDLQNTKNELLKINNEYHHFNINSNDNYTQTKSKLRFISEKLNNEQDRIHNQLENKHKEYKQENTEYKNNIKEFINNFSKIQNEAKEKEIIELNNEDTNQQQILMNDILVEINEVQKKIKEIKETNQFEVPRTIRNRYPQAYNINVFSYIKMIEDYKTILTIKLWICRNNLRQFRTWMDACSTIILKCNLDVPSKRIVEEQIQKLNKGSIKCIQKKNTIYESIVALSVAYIEIDGILADELAEAEIKRAMGIFYYCFPCIPRFIHDSTWVENSFINHIYKSAGKNIKKLQSIDKDKTNKSMNWMPYSYDDDDLIGDVMI